MKRSQWSYSTLSIALLIVCLVAVNVVFGFIPLRVDVTDDKLYTISEGTKKILDDLEDTVTIKLYFSKSYAELPPQFKAYAQRIEELLGEYVHLANDSIKLEVFDPEPDSEEEEWAQKYGISRVGLPSGDSFYLGMVALLLDQEVSIPFFDLRREKFLEYDISQTILSLNTPKAPKIGILSSLSIRGGAPQMGQPPGAGEWALYSELKKNFDVEILQTSIDEVPDAITLLLLMHPKRLSEQAQYAIDQYVLRGGRLIVFVDPNSNHEARNSRQQPGRPPDTRSDLSKLLKNWGVEYDAGKLVGDFRYATQINAGNGEIVRYPVWMSLTREALDAEHPITSQLEKLLFADAGVLKKVKDSPAEFTPIIQTSPDSGMVDAFMVQFSQPAQITRDMKTDQEPKVLAALLRDKFKTAYPEGRPPNVPKNSEEQNKKEEPLAPLKHEHLNEAKEAQSILIVADVDFASDTFSVQKLNFLGQMMIQPLNDNLNFVLNAVETLSGNDALMSIRSRGRFSRPFTRVLALENLAQLRFQKEESTLQKSLQEVQEKLKMLQERKDPKKNRLLTKEQQEEIRKFRLEELQTRKRLRMVRKSLRQDIESLGNFLLALNVLLIPGIVAILGVVSYRSRTRKRKI
ncbi:MAG: Gldg family protein [SAR324 cluster bacterium]|nr:Gldg family protein [SAR324 cluster bacterium]